MSDAVSDGFPTEHIAYPDDTVTLDVHEIGEQLGLDAGLTETIVSKNDWKRTISVRYGLVVRPHKPGHHLKSKCG